MDINGVSLPLSNRDTTTSAQTIDGASDNQPVAKPAVDEKSYVSKAIQQKEEAQIAE